MILLTRVDFRLLHGQVAASWVQGLGADCIFCVGDHVASDQVLRTALKLGKPPHVKLVIRDMAHAIEAINSGVTDRYRMIICVETVRDAKALLDGCPTITALNLGNTRESATTTEVTHQVYLEPDEVAMIRELVSRGVRVEAQALCADVPVDVVPLLRR